MSDRPIRYCDLCGGLDDHPRHVIAVPAGGAAPNEVLASVDGGPASAVAELLNDRVLIRHIDCCAAAGCEVCQATEAVTNGARGEQLLSAIEAGALAEVNVDGLNVGGI